MIMLKHRISVCLIMILFCFFTLEKLDSFLYFILCISSLFLSNGASQYLFGNSLTHVVNSDAYENFPW